MDEEYSPIVSNPGYGYGALENDSKRDICKSNCCEDKSQISFWSKLGFALGHVHNDLSACLWFSYCLLFLTEVSQLDQTLAGALIMFGQIVDAVATPILGYLMDRFSTKQKWHLFASFAVFVTVPMLYAFCPMCGEWPSWWQPVYVGIVIFFFQIGWPGVQVSHLAIIPELTSTQKDRNSLTSLRSSATFLSSIITFVITYFILQSGRASAEEKTSPKDKYRFRDISLIITLIGVAMTAIFQLSLTFGHYTEHSLKYKRLEEENHSEMQRSERRQKNFFKLPEMYLNTLLYIFSRIVATIASVYIPLWLNEQSGVELVALVPLVSYVASFLASLPNDYFIRLIGYNFMYLAGVLVTVLGSILVEVIHDAESSKTLYYIIGSCFGAGGSVTLTCSLCLIADMLADDSNQSGIVYSTVTTGDKLICGILIMAIQSHECTGKECFNYYKIILGRANGSIAFTSAIILGMFPLVKWIHRRRMTGRLI